MSGMISDAMNAALNEQVGSEFSASHNYLAMACAFNESGLKILAERFFAQADEERTHALKFVKYILEVGGTIHLGSVAQPKGEYSNPVKILEAALESELTVTRQINNLMDLTGKEKDHATRSFLQWFVDEQVEEVSSMRDLVQLAGMAKDMLQVESRVRHMMQTQD